VHHLLPVDEYLLEGDILDHHPSRLVSKDPEGGDINDTILEDLLDHSS
jgi:hypothetical protein